MYWLRRQMLWFHFTVKNTNKPWSCNKLNWVHTWSSYRWMIALNSSQGDVLTVSHKANRFRIHQVSLPRTQIRTGSWPVLVLWVALAARFIWFPRGKMSRTHGYHSLTLTLTTVPHTTLIWYNTTLLCNAAKLVLVSERGSSIFGMVRQAHSNNNNVLCHIRPSFCPYRTTFSTVPS